MNTNKSKANIIIDLNNRLNSMSSFTLERMIHIIENIGKLNETNIGLFVSKIVLLERVAICDEESKIDLATEILRTEEEKQRLKEAVKRSKRK